MKLFVLSALCIISVVASPLTNEENKIIGDAGEYVRISDGFSGFKFFDLEEEQEISPKFDVGRDTRFLVFTRLNPTIGQEIRINDINTVHNSHFSPSRPTRILVHGWQRYRCRNG